MLDFSQRLTSSSSGSLFIQQEINHRIFNDSSHHPKIVPSDSSSSILPVNSLPLSASKRSGRSAMATSVRIVIVGDVHDDWDPKEDSNALHLLQPDLVLFTGDFGNENVELVRSISNLDFPKAAILGNHDCWGTYDFQQKKVTLVQLQLDSLGKQHIGYDRLDMPLLKLSVVGGRPFSSGGHRIFRPKLLSQRYGVHNLEESKKKIIKAASGAPDGHSLVFLAHNGPSGLGSKMDDICGKDWVFEGGDHGDPDLAQALVELRNKKLPTPIPLVVFGHMHKGLAHGGLRKMLFAGAEGTLYLNGAIVPRVKKNLHGLAGSSRTSNGFHPDVRDDDDGGTLRAFSVVDIEGGIVVKISETWVLVTSTTTALQQEDILFQRS